MLFIYMHICAICTCEIAIPAKCVTFAYAESKNFVSKHTLHCF